MTWTEDDDEELEDEDDELDDEEPTILFPPDVLPELEDPLVPAELPELTDPILATGGGGLARLAAGGVAEDGTLAGGGWFTPLPLELEDPELDDEPLDDEDPALTTGGGTGAALAAPLIVSVFVTITCAGG